MKEVYSLQKRNKLPPSLQPQPMEEETNFCGTAEFKKLASLDS